MKKIALLLAALLPSLFVQAQFPGFVRTEWKPYYEDESEATRPFRDTFKLSNKIDPLTAKQVAGVCYQKITENKLRITELRNDGSPTDSLVHQEIADLQNSIEFYERAEGYYISIYRFIGDQKGWMRVIPVRQKATADFFFFGESENATKSADFFSDILVQSSIDKNILSTEVITAYLPKSPIYVPIRMALRTTVVDETDTSNQTRVSDKVLYGGLVNADLALPLFFHNTQYLTLYVPLTGRLSLDRVPVNVGDGDDDEHDPIFYGATSIECFVRAPFRTKPNTDGTRSKLAFYADARLSFVDGITTFYDNLRLVDNRYGFWVSQLNFGLDVDNKFRIGVNIPVFSTNEQVFGRKEATFGIQVDPKFLSKK